MSRIVEVDKAGLYDCGRVFSFLYRVFKPNSLSAVGRLLVLAFLPILILGGLAHHEGAFWYGSLKLIVPEGAAIGMSFMAIPWSGPIVSLCPR